MMWKVNLIFPLLVHQKREQIFINHILRSSKNSDTTMLVSIRTICCIILFQSIPVCIVYCECGALLTILKKVIPWDLSFYDFFSNYLVCEWSNSYCTLKKMSFVHKYIKYVPIHWVHRTKLKYFLKVHTAMNSWLKMEKIFLKG